MANPIFEQMNNSIPNGFWQKLNELKQTGGDPQKRVQELLNSGRVSQAQYNMAVQRMQMIQKMMGK